MSSSRETVRDALATLLNSALTISGGPAEAFYGYPVADFRGQSPVVVLASRGSERTMETMSTRRKSLFHLDIMSFTLYSDGSSWNEDDAEDRLDIIEQVIDQTIATNLVTSDWADIGYDGTTECGNATIGGTQYRYEVIHIVITKFHD
jgi:hypothetical protein